MKKNSSPTIFLFVLICFCVFNAQAQVGIGTTTIADGAILDISSTDKGLLIPRVNITDLATAAPVTTPTEGLMVYNTNTTTGPGFFFWDGTDWSSIGGTSSGNDHDWYEVGGTSAPNNINDNKFTGSGQIIVNGTTPNAGDRFTVVGAGDDYALNAYAVGAGSAIYAQNIGAGTALMAVGTQPAPSVYSTNTGDGNALYAISGGAGATLYTENDGGYDAINAFADSGTMYNAMWAINSDGAGTAILAGSGGYSVYSENGAGVAASGLNSAIYGYTASAASGNTAASFTLDIDGDPSTANERSSAEIAGYNSSLNAEDNGGSMIGSQPGYYGGYFNGWGAYAYVGLYHDFNPGNGNGGTFYKIVGNGSNSTLIDDAEGKPRVLFSPEAPEILFQDFGVGKMINGEARIEIDPVLKQALYVDEEHPLKVFITLEGDCNGVYVTDKSIDGFTVKELNSGNSNVSFSWQLVANRADIVDENGIVKSKHVGVRLPYGPEPLPERKAKAKKIEKQEPIKIEAKQHPK